MAEKRRKGIKAIEDFLIQLEEKIGEGIVVSLLIENKQIFFESAIRRDRYEQIENDDEPDIITKPLDTKGILEAGKPKLDYIS